MTWLNRIKRNNAPNPSKSMAARIKSRHAIAKKPSTRSRKSHPKLAKVVFIRDFAEMIVEKIASSPEVSRSSIERHIDVPPGPGDSANFRNQVISKPL